MNHRLIFTDSALPFPSPHILKTQWHAILWDNTQGTPTKRQVSKRQVSKRLVSKRLKRQAYKTSALQNVRFTKCQVYKTSGLQNVRLKKNIHIYILYLWLVEIRKLCCSHVCRQSDGCVLFSNLEVILPYITIISNNDTLFTLNSSANLAIPIFFV